MSGLKWRIRGSKTPTPAEMPLKGLFSRLSFESLVEWPPGRVLTSRKRGDPSLVVWLFLKSKNLWQKSGETQKVLEKGDLEDFCNRHSWDCPFRPGLKRTFCKSCIVFLDFIGIIRAGPGFHRFFWCKSVHRILRNFIGILAASTTALFIIDTVDHLAAVS